MKISLEISPEDLKAILDKNERKEIENNERKEVFLDEYVFIPIVDNVEYKYEDQTLILSKNGVNIVEVIIPDKAKHITRINSNNGEIHNILELNGYAIDENSLGLVQTLDSNDYVKGLLLNGKLKIYFNGLSKQKFIVSKDDLLHKLYIIDVDDVDLQNDVKINLITTSKPIRKTNYHHLKGVAKDKLKMQMKGIIDLYRVKSEARDSLIDELIYIVQYHSM